jgi:hypothetical protein
MILFESIIRLPGEIREVNTLKTVVCEKKDCISHKQIAQIGGLDEKESNDSDLKCCMEGGFSKTRSTGRKS